MTSARPNILVIQADQLAAKYLGAYGYPIASTPHIDSLAASGAVARRPRPTHPARVCKRRGR